MSNYQLPTEEEKQKAKEIAHQILNNRKKENKKDSISGARYYLFFIAGISLLRTLFLLSNPLDAGVGAFFSLVYFVLAFRAKSKPFSSLLTALIIIVTVSILEALLIEGRPLMFSLFRLIPISILGFGTYYAYKFRQKKKVSNPKILDAE